MSSVGILGVLTNIWTEQKAYRFYCGKLKPLRNNASPSNTNNAHISQTTTRTPEIRPPMCSPCSCGHVDLFSFDIFNVYSVFSCPKVEFYAFSSNQFFSHIKHESDRNGITQLSIVFFPIPKHKADIDMK